MARRVGVVAVLTAFALSACGSDEAPTSGATTTPSPLSTATVAATSTPAATPLPSLVVHAGESIQAAIDAAAPNSRILVEPGVYQESSTRENGLTITTDGLQLIALSPAENPVVLTSAGTQLNGIWVSPADTVGAPDDENPPCGISGTLVHGFALKGFTLRGFGQFGVYLACNDGYTLDGNIADGNRFYGLFPVRSHNGALTNNEALNTPKDAAIYVGQSDHVTVSGNHSHDSLIGIEVENSSDVTVNNNEVDNDTVGLLADAVPGVQQEGQTNIVFTGNKVHDNNRPNTGEPPDFTSVIPPGSGILTSSGSNITIQGNQVSNNGFGGIVIDSYFLPYPMHVRVLDNTLTANGLHPPPTPGLAAFAGDVIWDGQGTDVCARGNTAAAHVTVKGMSGSLPTCP